ncbi:MAG: 50S ribosomal protein L9 [Patescibacteria group bacterium]
MEILLIQDVAGIGKKNDLLIVGDGYALNYLLPHRKALVATPTVRKRYADQIRKRAEEKERERNLRANAAQALAGKSVTISRKASKVGKLYAAVSESQIAEAVSGQLGYELKKDAVELEDHIKNAGTFPVKVKLGEGITQVINVIVNAE